MFTDIVAYPPRMAVPAARSTMGHKRLVRPGGGAAGCHPLLTHSAALDNERREFDSLNRFSGRRDLAVRMTVLVRTFEGGLYA